MADLVIRGMEMPKENDAPILAWICSDGDVVFFQNPTKFLHGETTGTAYGKKATAIQLPEGHGRLIDADALKTGLFVSDEITRNYYINRKEIENAPIIVPAEGGGEDESETSELL